MSAFKEFSLLPSIIDRLKLKGYKQATPIQKACIPALINGCDLLGIAQTGTGKTAAFSLPIINNFALNKVNVTTKSTRSLILTPTRELASQIMQNIDDYAEGLGLKTKVVYGGVGRQAQVNAIANGLDILVATPGRLLDLIATGDIHFKELKVFVLDKYANFNYTGYICQFLYLHNKVKLKLYKQRHFLRNNFYLLEKGIL